MAEVGVSSLKWVFMVVILVVLQFQTHQQVMNLEWQEADARRIDNAMQLASQDAVEQVASTNVGDGQVVFNQSVVDTAFKATLAANLDLNSSTLQPNPNTMLSVAPTILVETFLDSSNTTFPYTYTNSTYGINKTLYEPSVIYVLQFTIPSYASNVSPFTMDVPMVQSYHYTA